MPELDIEAGARLAFVGPSGCGKSTLLELLAMLLRPTAAQRFEFAPDGTAHDLSAAWRADSNDVLTDLRSRHIGFVLQTGGLLPYLSIADNITLPLRLNENVSADEARQRACVLATTLDIADQLTKLPAELSVGQRQRAAIARALIHRPAVVIADEPTAAIDPASAESIMTMLAALAVDEGVTLLLATHAVALARSAGFRTVPHRLGDGGVGADVTVGSA